MLMFFDTISLLLFNFGTYFFQTVWYEYSLIICNSSMLSVIFFNMVRLEYKKLTRMSSQFSQ